MSQNSILYTKVSLGYNQSIRRNDMVNCDVQSFENIFKDFWRWNMHDKTSIWSFKRTCTYHNQGKTILLYLTIFCLIWKNVIEFIWRILCSITAAVTKLQARLDVPFSFIPMLFPQKLREINIFIDCKLIWRNILHVRNAHCEKMENLVAS